MSDIAARDILSTDDFGRVICMARALPPDQNLADEPGLMLALHHRRFPAADVALLAPYVAAKARELRAALGLDDPREAVAGLFFFLALASATFFFCFVAPEEAQAHALTPAPELPGPFAWLLATATVVIVTLTIWGLSTVATEWRQMRDFEEAAAEPPPRDDVFWGPEQWAAFDERIADLRQRAWHVYIAMGMSGDLADRPPNFLSPSQVSEAFAYVSRAVDPTAERNATTEDHEGGQRGIWVRPLYEMDYKFVRRDEPPALYLAEGEKTVPATASLFEAA